MLMVTVRRLPSGGGEAYYCVPKIIFLLAYSSWKQHQRKLSIVAYYYFAWHASQNDLQTKYICVSLENTIHYTVHHVLSRDTNILAQGTSNLCMRTRLLCRNLEFKFLQIKMNFSLSTKNCNLAFCTFLWATCTSHFIKRLPVELCRVFC